MRTAPRRQGVLEGSARIASQPKVVQLNDNGERKVVLRIEVEQFSFEIELPDAELLSRSVSYAQAWVREG